MAPVDATASPDSAVAATGDEERRAREVEKERRAREAEEERAALAAARDVYGPVVARNLASARWGDRRDAFEAIRKELEARARAASSSPPEPEDAVVERFAVSCALLRRGFADRVAPVCFEAFETFRLLLKSHPPELGDVLARTGESATALRVRAMTSATVTPLLEKMAGEATGTNRRMQREACHTLLRLARTPELDGLAAIVPRLAEAAGGTPDTPAALRPRLGAIKLLLAEFGFAKRSGLKLALAMGLAVPALAIADDKTRKAAVEVVVQCHTLAGRKKVEPFLAPVKPAMLKVLHRKFAEADADACGTNQAEVAAGERDGACGDELAMTVAGGAASRAGSDAAGDNRGDLFVVQGRSYLAPLGSNSGATAADIDSPREIDASVGGVCGARAREPLCSIQRSHSAPLPDDAIAASNELAAAGVDSFAATCANPKLASSPQRPAVAGVGRPPVTPTSAKLALKAREMPRAMQRGLDAAPGFVADPAAASSSEAVRAAFLVGEYGNGGAYAPLVTFATTSPTQRGARGGSPFGTDTLSLSAPSYHSAPTAASFAPAPPGGNGNGGNDSHVSPRSPMGLDRADEDLMSAILAD